MKTKKKSTTGKTPGEAPDKNHSAEDTTTGSLNEGYEANLRPGYIVRIPDWIYADPGFRDLSGGERYSLWMIACRCDNPALPDYAPAQGNLLACVCGVDMCALAGCDRKTFARHVAKFEQLGFVVVVGRGGGRLANTVAIPAARGSLDAVAAPPGADIVKYDREEMYKRLLLVGRNAPVTLVGQNAPLTLVGQNAPAPSPKCPGTRGEMPRHPGRNAPLPSSSHLLNQRPIPKNNNSSDRTDSDSATSSRSPRRQGEQAQVIGEAQPQHPGFEEFRRRYPRPEGLAKARTYWIDNDLEPQAATILAGLEKWKNSSQWRDNDPKYLPGMLKFLEEERWTKPPQEAPVSGDTIDLSKTRYPTAREIEEIFGDDDEEESPPGFEKFWAIYPAHRRGGRPAMIYLWRRKGLEAKAGQIIGGLEIYKASDEWRERGIVPGMEKFIEGEMWIGAADVARGSGEMIDLRPNGFTREEFREIWGDDYGEPRPTTTATAAPSTTAKFTYERDEDIPF